MNLKEIQQLKSEIEQELTGGILPFWMEKTPDHKYGGFIGRMDNNLRVYPKAKKCCILYSRILWTFAAAYRLRHDERYLAMADRAYDYLLKYFWDERYSGLYLLVNHRGRVAEPRKLVYNLSFGIYGFSEYYRATGNGEALDRAIHLYRLIEEYCHDNVNGGYFEACSRDWRLITSMHLTRRILHEKKSMNTHLHILEAYTNLLRVWDDPGLRQSIRQLIGIFEASIIDSQTGHFKIFFDEYWNSKLDSVSYGHDIEGSWLLYEATQTLNDEAVLNRVKARVIDMVERIYQEARDDRYGGIFYELEDGELNTKKVWWVQCEALVGFYNAYQLTGESRYLDAISPIWKFARQFLMDQQYGEWYYEVSRDGKPNEKYYKVGPWKCPYHSGRACMELMTRMENFAGSG